MTDVYLSYARADRAQAMAIAAALEAKDYAVWYDGFAESDELRGEMEQALSSTKCVLVIWSQAAIKNRWVIAEATEGKDRGILVPVMVESIGRDLPSGFRSRTAADLSKWRGHRHNPAWQEVLRQVAHLVERGGATPQAAAPHQPTAPHPAPSTSAAPPTTSRGRVALDLPRAQSATRLKPAIPGAAPNKSAARAPHAPASLLGAGQSQPRAAQRPTKPRKKRLDISLIAGVIGFAIGLGAIVFATFHGLGGSLPEDLAAPAVDPAPADTSAAPIVAEIETPRGDAPSPAASLQTDAAAPPPDNPPVSPGADAPAPASGAPSPTRPMVPAGPRTTLQSVEDGLAFALATASGTGRADSDGRVTVRAGPGPRYPVLGIAEPGQPLTLTGEAEVGHWYMLSWPTEDADEDGGATQIGYVYGPLIISDGQTLRAGQTARVRSGPGGRFGSLGVLQEGTAVPAEGKVGGVDWYQVQWDGDVGYVFADRILPPARAGE